MAKRIAVELLLMLAIGLALGLIGPFGSYEMPTFVRIAYWMMFGLAGYAIFRPLVVVGRWLSEALHISPIIGTGLAQIIAAMPATLLIASMMSGFRMKGILAWDGIGLLYFQVLLIGALIYALFIIAFRPSANETEPSPAQLGFSNNPISVEPPRYAESLFHDQLPPGFGPLLALKSEDHYVRAMSAHRSVLVLARLRDAVSGLGSAEGMQVHRSWWIAREAIVGTKRDGRALTVLLSTGIEVPVSRENIAAFKATGWLSGLPQEGTE